MTRSAFGVIAGVLMATPVTLPQAADTVVVAVPARAGAVDGTTQNFDEFIWRLFTQFTTPVDESKASPVVFETWASDADTFSKTPHWPDPGAPKKLQASVLRAMNTTHGGPVVDVPCKPPGNAAVGGFPTTGTPAPCVAEEVKRNRAQYDYIVENKLNTQAGLAAAYAKSFADIGDRGQGRLGSRADAAAVDSRARQHRQHPQALLHQHVRGGGVRGGVAACQQPAERELGLGHVRAADEPGPLRPDRLFRHLRCASPGRRAEQAGGQHAIWRVQEDAGAEGPDERGQPVAGVGKLLHEVDPGRLQRAGWHALCAG